MFRPLRHVAVPVARRSLFGWDCQAAAPGAKSAVSNCILFTIRNTLNESTKIFCHTSTLKQYTNPCSSIANCGPYVPSISDVFFLFALKHNPNTSVREHTTYAAYVSSSLPSGSEVCRFRLQLVLMIKMSQNVEKISSHVWLSCNVLKTTDCKVTLFSREMIIHGFQFLPRDAMLARYMLSSCVCPSVCPSQADTVPKRSNVGSRKQRHTIAHTDKQTNKQTDSHTR